MQTVWNGMGLPSSNMLWTEAFAPVTVSVVLSETPHVVTRVTLPAALEKTHGVTLWTAQDQVWYALDEDPGPIPTPASGTLIAETAFVAGGVLFPDSLQLITLPNDSMQHVLHLLSAAPSPLVYVTALIEDF